MKKFQDPEMNVSEFEVEEILTSSVNPEETKPENPEGGLGWG